MTTNWAKRDLDLDENIPPRREVTRKRRTPPPIEMKSADFCNWCGSSIDAPTISANGYKRLHVRCADKMGIPASERWTLLDRKLMFTISRADGDVETVDDPDTGAKIVVEPDFRRDAQDAALLDRLGPPQDSGLFDNRPHPLTIGIAVTLAVLFVIIICGALKLWLTS